VDVPDHLPPDDEIKPTEGPLEVSFQGKDQAARAQILLTKHEDRTFEDQFVPLTGHAYIRCRMVRCTLVYDGAPFMAEGCHFENCNVKLSATIMWGVEASQKDFSVLSRFVAFVTGTPA
jgi:hypothetical protein